MPHHLVVTAMGRDRPAVAHALIAFVSQCGCNIVDSQLAILGQEFTLSLLLSGDWNALARLESTLPEEAQKLALITLIKRTQQAEPAPDRPSATAVLLVPDSPGLISRLTDFIRRQGWDIRALQSVTLSEQQLLRAGVVIRLPAQADLPQAAHAFKAFAQTLGALQAHFTPTPNQEENPCQS
ncbi:ACT domain-containing protein [Pseudaeromonas sp. ZJS20]|uniref:glycine cleavage system protein R n=1 Tax=Pseudaeromonas aegiceratis TaxID=3153928 RepID=UPI00390C6AB5